MKNNSAFLKDNKNIITYSILAYAISWAIGVPLALGKQGIIRPIFPLWTHYFVAFGPLILALIVTYASQGPSGLKEIGKRMILWRVRPIWWVAAVSPLIIGIVAGLILNLTTGNKITLHALGDISFLPPIGIGALFLWIVTFGIGEEAGWRGYALPRLQKTEARSRQRSFWPCYGRCGICLSFFIYLIRELR